MLYAINSPALIGKKNIKKEIHAILMHSYATFNILVPRPSNYFATRYRVKGKTMDASLQYWPNVGDIINYTGKGVHENFELIYARDEFPTILK